ATNLTPDQHGELFFDAIIEGPSKWKVRPVFEIYSDSVINQTQTYSALAGNLASKRQTLIRRGRALCLCERPAGARTTRGAHFCISALQQAEYPPVGQYRPPPTIAVLGLRSGRRCDLRPYLPTSAGPLHFCVTRSRCVHDRNQPKIHLGAAIEN